MDSHNGELISSNLEKIAEEIYDYCCAARSKDKKSPREIGCEFSKLMDSPKEFYRHIAQWHLEHLTFEI